MSTDKPMNKLIMDRISLLEESKPKKFGHSF